MLNSLVDTYKNFDLKIKKVMINGLYFSLAISIVGALFLAYYMSVFHSNLIYYIGIEIVHLSISFAASFLVSAFAVDKIKKDLA